MTDLMGRLRALQMSGALNLPLPGAGHTAARHAALLDFGREDLALARLIEAHADALAILAEAGRSGDGRHTYGVWASDSPQGRVTATPLPDGGWRLEGVKPYCSGSTLVDAALVTGHAEAGVLLFEVALRSPGISARPTPWVSHAMADTVTGPVAFAGVNLAPSALLGDANWYLLRPGFWHGAVGPAACWAGGAISLVEAATALNRKDPHSRANVGALEAMAWGMRALLAQSGSEIDRDPADLHRQARRRALQLRHLVERWCTEVMDRFGRATGPQLLAFDEGVVRQYSALTVFIRQCHAERDMAAIPD